ncbi:MAG: hypothetical protein ACYC5Q_11115 [Thermoleophilia bacterium]
MNKRLALKGATLIAVGALGLVGLGALGPVFNPGSAAAEGTAPSWQRQVTVQPAASGDSSTGGTTSDSSRARITDMIRAHLGITGDQANQLAGSMEDMMRSVHGDQTDEMLTYCEENGGPAGMMGNWNGDGSTGGSSSGSPDGTDWGGMMGGSGNGGGMMGGGSGGMMGGSGYGGGMMGGWGNN